MSSTYPLIQAANDFFFLPVANSGLIKVEKQIDGCRMLKAVLHCSIGSDSLWA